jgi:SpoVK/Ycf46/Vps4 family AAA+-type ATPase
MIYNSVSQLRKTKKQMNEPKSKISSAAKITRNGAGDVLTEAAPIKRKPIKFCNVANKPILSPEVELEVHSAVAQFLGQDRWRDWGLRNYRRQGSFILMYGAPGCGKTLTASYLTQLIGRPLAALDLSTFGSSTPGEGERIIAQFFAESEGKGATVFLDELDGVLWDRSKAGESSMWMVAIINKLLTEIADYKHLVVGATNHEHILDTALRRRVIAYVHVTRPDFQTRIRLWKAKMPKKFPIQLTPIQMETLAQYNLTGATIENAVFKEAQYAILQNRDPQFESLCNVAKTFEGI